MDLSFMENAPRMDYDTVAEKFGIDVADLHRAAVAEMGSAAGNRDATAMQMIEGMAFFKVIGDLESQDDTAAALAHAGGAKQNPEVVALLKDIGCPKLLAGCGWPPDGRRFRGLATIFAALVAKGADTTANLDLIFGDHRRVRGALLSHKHQFADAPAGSPAAAMGALHMSGRRERICDVCGASEAEGARIQNCGGCGVARYCGTKCQKTGLEDAQARGRAAQVDIRLTLG